MNLTLSPPRLRLTLTTAVAALVTTLLIFDKGYEIAFELPRHVQQRQTVAAHLLMDKVQQMLSGDMTQGRLRSAERNLTVQGSDPNVELLTAIDHQGDVLFSTRFAHKGRPARQVLAEFDMTTFRETQKNRRIIVKPDDSGGSIEAYAPLLLAAEPGKLRPTNVGALYLKFDLVRARRNAWRNALASDHWLHWIGAVVLSTAFFLFVLNRWVSTPLRNLERTVKRLAQGDDEVRSEIQGSSEIAQLGQSFNELSHKIDASKAALRQANLHLEQKVEQRTAHLQHEIKNRKEAELARSASEERLKSVLETVTEGVALWDAQGTLQYANPSFKRLLGCDDCSSMSVDSGENVFQMVDADGNLLGQDELPVAQALADHQPRESVVLGIEAPGSTRRWLNFNVALVKNVDDLQITGVVSSVTDITDQKLQENRLDHLAHFDALTGLPNRLLLQDRMHQLIAQAQRSKSILAFCLLDLDGFKQVNDTMGHEAGDELLIEAAERLMQSVREGDTVARLGGDEFVVLLAGIENDIACEAILNRMLNTLAKPYPVSGGRHANVTASIGVTLYPTDQSDPDTLLRHADHAMYAAKRFGKNCFEWFNPRHEQRVRARHDTLKDLRRALERGELILHYQPKIACSDGRVVGAEALIRWQHPVLGLLPPAQFLPLVEEHDLSLKIGEFVFIEALRQAALWRHAGNALTVSVNVFARQLQRANFTERLAEIVEPYREKNALHLDLEIVETAALEGIRDIAKLVEECKALDVSFSLDDFGTGYSTLDHLRRIPAHTLKIEKTFIQNMVNSDERTLITAIIGLGHTFGREVVAEGVETSDQVQWLREAGCDIMQGYYFAQPMEPAKFDAWLRSYQPDTQWSDKTYASFR